MGFLARLFGAVPREEQDGIRLTEAEPWLLRPTKDVARFLRALPSLVPENSIAYVEGTGEAHVAKCLQRVSIQPQVRVAIGTIWPKPDSYHLPLTEGNVEALAVFLEENPAGCFCDHFHVYRDGEVLLEWHDAFSDDPIYVSRSVGEHAIARFTEALGSSYSCGWTPTE
jgi:hypothetical protein